MSLNELERGILIEPMFDIFLDIGMKPTMDDVSDVLLSISRENIESGTINFKAMATVFEVPLWLDITIPNILTAVEEQFNSILEKGFKQRWTLYLQSRYVKAFPERMSNMIFSEYPSKDQVIDMMRFKDNVKRFDNAKRDLPYIISGTIEEFFDGQ